MSDLFRFAQVQPYTLSGAGAVIGNTTITLRSMTDIDGNALTMSGTFGDIGFGTLSPGSGTLEEQICFTGLTNNANGTVTLTGVKSVSFVYPYTQTTGLLKTHAGASPFIISNTSGFYDKLTSKSDDEIITGQWTFTQSPIVPDPTFPTDAANKEYVDGVVTSGAPNADDYTKGIVQLATRAQMAAGTTLGTTGAHLVLTAERATSTGAGGTTVAVITQSNGTIAPLFIDQTGNYTFTGTETFTGTTVISGISTISGTTTISAVVQPITQTAGALVQFTSNSQYPANNGELIKNVEKMVSSATADKTLTTVDQTIVSYLVPANTLGTSRAIRLKFPVTIPPRNPSLVVNIKLKYGVTTVASVSATVTNTRCQGIVEAVLYSSGATNSQYGTIGGLTQTLIGDVASIFNVSGTSAVDSTSATTVYLLMSQTDTGGGAGTVFGGTVEVI